VSKVDVIRGKTIAVTGHRVMEKNFDIKGLEKLFLALIEKNFDTFLIGMAIGFDTVCFQTLEKIRKSKDIKIVACVPCKGQDLKFNFEQKKEYKRMLSVADDIVLVSEEYDDKCMQRRNEFMVNNASGLVAYVRREYGGSVNTVRYAIKNNVSVLKV